MGKMKEELERRLDENKYELHEACKGARSYFRTEIVTEFIETGTIPYFAEYPALVKVLAKIEGG